MEISVIAVSQPSCLYSLRRFRIYFWFILAFSVRLRVYVFGWLELGNGHWTIHLYIIDCARCEDIFAESIWIVELLLLLLSLRHAFYYFLFTRLYASFLYSISFVLCYQKHFSFCPRSIHIFPLAAQFHQIFIIYYIVLYNYFWLAISVPILDEIHIYRLSVIYIYMYIGIYI